MWETPRGFTGHEHLDSVGLIHMGGRVYDPEIGRFLSADPFVQAPETTQSFNRYSYVNNNPLSFTDPSGFFWKKIKKGFKRAFKAGTALQRQQWKNERALLGDRHIGPVIQVVAIAVAAYFCGPCAIGVSAAISAARTQIAGGSLTDIIVAGGRSAAIATLSYGVGQFFAEAGIATASGLGGSAATATTQATASTASLIVQAVAKAVAHGIVQGIGSELQGGSFLSGFAAGSIASASIAGAALAGAGDVGQLVAAAVGGGVGAELGGGKFVNGAISGAFVYLLNDFLHSTQLAQNPNTSAKWTIVNLDSSTARALVGEGSPFLREISEAIGNRTIIMSATALKEFTSKLHLAGPNEFARAQRLLSVVVPVPDHPSERALALRTSQRVGAADTQIFGTGDFLGVTTFTSDQRFVEGAKAQGVYFDVFTHRPFSFVGQ